ncbi:MAG: hypothetical protein QOG91_546 [Candidatus Parcubacteria bacterium]|jgi:cell division protein FtsI/penicillin-binding protein 2|nr:hypothetical protein [Candidatus Parcubacteria bacterium]
MNSKQRLRAQAAFVLIALAGLILCGSLYWTQIVEGETYAAKADEQYVKPAGTLFDRGSVFFQLKDGTRAAASTVASGFVVYANPSQIASAARAYEALAQYLKLDSADFEKKAQKKDDQYEVIANEVNAKSAQSVKDLEIAGIGVAPENWLSYPGGALAAQALGIVGEDSLSSTVSGRYGLQKTYDDVLARAGIGGSSNIFAELFGGLGSVFGAGAAKEGDIVTSIEPTTQRYLENILNQTEGVWHADEIGGIIIDPQTGEIVAMSSLPSFDPNNTAAVKDVKVFSNPLVENVYEMGSIMKPLTMATALDTGAVTPASTYDDTGTMTLSGKKISNFDGKARGVIPMQQILSQSLNVGAATIALKVGKDAFAAYFEKFGLGEKTGIDEPNEATGIVKNLKTGRDIEIATAAYGQGLAVSPVNMARALSILANGGYVVTPHLVTEIDYGDGSTKAIEPEKTGPVLAKKTIDEVTSMLVKVVDEAIAKKHPDIHWQHYSIAAKTGTAQIPNPAKGGYYDDRYLHSFFGYFPAYNPKFLVFLYQVNPKGAEFASETLTDPFSEIAKFLINYNNIPPDR